MQNLMMISKTMIYDGFVWKIDEEMRLEDTFCGLYPFRNWPDCPHARHPKLLF